MPGLGDIVQKAIYLGVGLASYAGERAGGRLGELKSQIQKLADEMVARGEMTTEEARRLVEDLMRQAQQSPTAAESPAEKPSSEPRRIEILSDEDEPESGSQKPHVQNLRDQVLGLQEELQRLKRDRQ
ncbi:MAG: hypothetical protein JO235_16140 [Chroococcidiopsidaceae cyanobacterium CP_BM_RX_35]|nr:hypothetical protein [Chroococcidiopsidaceae cyanobacterium CP_BM_RX_35]